MLFASTLAHAQDVPTLLAQARDALAVKNYEAAADIYTRVIEADRTNSEATYNRAVCWLAMGEHERAFEGLTAAIALEPDYPAAYLNRGSIAANRKEYPEAIADFTRALALDSASIPALYMRGQINLQVGLLAEGVRDLRDALALEGATARSARIAALLAEVGFAQPSGRHAAFTDDARSISIELPTEWHRKVEDDGKTLNMFVSEQKVQAQGDAFMVGVTVHRIRRMSMSFEHVQKDGAWLARYWSKALSDEGKKLHRYEVISSEDVAVGKHVGTVRLVELQHAAATMPVRMYELILGHDDEIVTVNLEAPTALFADYDRAFKNALATLQIM